MNIGNFPWICMICKPHRRKKHDRSRVYSYCEVSVAWLPQSHRTFDLVLHPDSIHL